MIHGKPGRGNPLSDFPFLPAFRLRDCAIISPEFGWFVHQVEMERCSVQGEYFMLRSDHLTLREVHLKGKYSFQCVENALPFSGNQLHLVLSVHNIHSKTPLHYVGVFPPAGAERSFRQGTRPAFGRRRTDPA